jgi:hypothetical protein
MPQTDITKAKAIRRAGHACEVCGAPVRFRSARFLEVESELRRPFEAEDCCVLCERCFEELDTGEEASGATSADDHPDEGERGGARRVLTREEIRRRSEHSSWLANDDPDGGLCA